MDHDEQAIRDMIARWMEANRRGDLDAVLGMMTDDVVFMVPGQEPFGKEEFAAASRAMADLRMDGSAEVVELRVLGDWAFMRAHLDLTITPPHGSPERKAGYTLTVLRKGADGLWRLTRDANLLAAA
jgi:uncharacterized protein (TIGR02246 family)